METDCKGQTQMEATRKRVDPMVSPPKMGIAKQEKTQVLELVHGKLKMLTNGQKGPRGERLVLS